MVPMGVSYKHFLEVNLIRTELRELFASLDGEARDKFVYLHAEEYDHTDEDTVNYLAEHVIEQVVVLFQCKAPLFDAEISRQPRDKFMIPAITTDQYNAYLEETAAKDNPAIRSSIEQRERRENEFKEKTGRTYIPNSTRINDVTQKLITFMSKYEEERAKRNLLVRLRNSPFYFWVLVVMFASGFAANWWLVNGAAYSPPLLKFIGVLYLLVFALLLLEPLFNPDFSFWKRDKREK